MTRTLFFLFLCTTLLCQAGGKKENLVFISFHLEASDLQSKKLAVKVPTPLGNKFMLKSPFLTSHNIIAYQDFISPNAPNTYGIKCMLDRIGANRLSTITAQHKGKWVLCAINGQIVDFLYIDRQISGKYITIWRGIDSTTLQHLNNLFPKIGEPKKEWEKRLKEEAKASR